MQIEMLKQPGGVLIPANDSEADRMQRFKSGNLYLIEIKLVRNPQFHKKVFAFFGFCFEYWERPEHEYQDHKAQFDYFRKHLTCLAGHYFEVYDIKGNLRVEAKSLSFGNMEQEEFERVYKDLIGAALRVIFKGCNDSNIENRLLGFF